MPISCHIDHARRRLYTRAQGLISYADMLAHVNTELSPEAATYGELIDCTDATTNVTPEEIRKLAAERQRVDDRQRRPGAVAIVTHDNLLFGMLRMYDALTNRIRPIRVFRDSQEAAQWLDSVG